MKPLHSLDVVALRVDRKSFTSTKLARLAVKESDWSFQRLFEMSYLRNDSVLFLFPLGFFPRWHMRSVPETFPNFPRWFWSG